MVVPKGYGVCSCAAYSSPGAAAMYQDLANNVGWDTLWQN